MATKILNDLSEGQILVSTTEAVKLGSELIDDEYESASMLEKLSQLQVAIETKGIRAVAFANKEALYTSTDLKVPKESLL